MNLFRLGEFVLHSGAASKFKIDCDSLGDADWECLARMTADLMDMEGGIFAVEGVPTGGLRFAAAVRPYVSHAPGGRLLIVDDVLTSGRSMEEQRAGRNAVGVVAFARGPCPEWVRPIFRMWG